MQKKTFLQLFLLFGILIISIIFFKTYFVKKKINNSSINVIKEEDTLTEKNSNIIHNIEYTSNRKNEIYFVITS